MPQTLVITLVGPDRPGLVQRVASVVQEQGGNWTGSQMAHMAGRFAGVVCVQCNDDQAAALTVALQNLSESGLSVHVSAGDGQAQSPETQIPSKTLMLQFIGLDRPGLVREMTAALASRQVNVQDLETQVVNAPMSGEQMFQACAELAVPAGADPDGLCEELEAIAERLELDISFELPATELE